MEMPLTSPMFGFSALFLPPSSPGTAPARRGAELAGGRDRSDAELAEALELVLEGDDDLLVLPEGRALAVERLERAEAHRGGDHAIGLVGTDRVVDEGVVGDVFQPLVDRSLVVRTLERSRWWPSRGREGGEDVHRQDRRLGHELGDHARERGPVAVGARQRVRAIAAAPSWSGEGVVVAESVGEDVPPAATRPRNELLNLSTPVSITATALSWPS